MRSLPGTCALVVVVVVSGCRGAPVVTPIVTNEIAPPAMTGDEAHDACIAAVRADPDEDDELEPVPPVAHAVPIENDRIVCAVELRGPEHEDTMREMTVRAVEITVGVIARHGQGWRLTDRAVTTLEEGRGDHGGRDATVELAPVAIRNGETAVLVTMIQGEDGPEYGRDETQATLYRVVDDQLTAVYEATWTATTGEADNVERRALTLASTATAGFRDLEISIDRHQVEWATGGHCPIEYTIGERWTWAGDTYELADAEEPPEEDPCDPDGDSDDDAP